MQKYKLGLYQPWDLEWAFVLQICSRISILQEEQV